ncbi:MAG: hypothetical protein C4576_05365 [Desulfobacteraceae bacterium]|nr:MAG: hypothetical protein C4576_05365 [Desulfobacteraceae bacterium]
MQRIEPPRRPKIAKKDETFLFSPAGGFPADEKQISLALVDTMTFKKNMPNKSAKKIRYGNYEMEYLVLGVLAV